MRETKRECHSRIPAQMCEGERISKMAKWVRIITGHETSNNNKTCIFRQQQKKTEKNLVDVINVKILERAAYCSLIND